MVTGNPVRAANFCKVHVTREEGIKHSLDWTHAKKTILLSVGGSLGAKSINEAIDQNIELLSLNSNSLQLIWQTGKPYLQRKQKNVVQWVKENIYDK